MKVAGMLLVLASMSALGQFDAVGAAVAAQQKAIAEQRSAGSAGKSARQALESAEAAVDAEKIRAHVKFLSDDLLEGRGPGLRVAEIAAQYIATQFATYGLKPAGDNGTYLQQINFVGMKAIANKTTMSLLPKHAAGMGIELHSIDLKYADDYTVSNRKLTPTEDVDAPIVFVGYGVTAPEFGWDDYAGVDVKGKVILCIVGDPPSDDPKFFGGKALTYYGRWTYKFEQAARMGAVGALIIHRTDLASYGWDVVKNSNTSEKTYLRDNADPQLEAASWIQLAVAQQLFASAGMNIDEQMAAAGKRGFKAVELPVRLKAHIESVVRPFQSANVVGMLTGPDCGGRDGRSGCKPGLDQAVLYTAHYDHLGFAAGMAGDNIYNGAADNATGCGMLLEMARVWAASGLKVPHSVIFAAVTAEETARAPRAHAAPKTNARRTKGHGGGAAPIAIGEEGAPAAADPKGAGKAKSTAEAEADARVDADAKAIAKPDAAKPAAKADPADAPLPVFPVPSTEAPPPKVPQLPSAP